MTDDSQTGPKGGEEVDPLSATAMFLRTLDKQSKGSPAEPPAKFDFGVSQQPAGLRDAFPLGAPSESGNTEFTAIFGNDKSPQSTPASSVPPRSASADPLSSEPAWSESDPAAKQSPGEFTRLFVKGGSASPKPPARPHEPASEPLPSTPSRAKGFSSPGVSDAASAETGFSQFFKPATKIPAAPAQQSQPPSVTPTPYQPVTPRPSSTPGAIRNESPFGRPSDQPVSSSQDPQSITSIIQSLSSPAAPGGKSSTEPAPYRPESAPPTYQPVAKPAAPSGFDSGGVTQFIQRLAEMPPAPAAEAPAVPVRNVDSGPGEYTRIISVPTKSAASAPATPASTPAPAAPSPAFVRPVVPAIPVVPAVPPLPAMAPHAAPLPAAAPPAIPLPRFPPMPAPPAVAAPAVAAPKGKLEALVPMLLVVNTFLLVMILVVLIFLIKSR